YTPRPPSGGLIRRTVFGGKVGRFPTWGRRGVAAALDAGVVRIQSTAGREPDGIDAVEPVYRWVMLNRKEWGSMATNGLFPQTVVQEGRTRMIFVITGPLEASQCFEALIAHAGMIGAQPAQFVPDIFSSGMSPIIAELKREVTDDGNVIARLPGRLQGFAHTLNTSFTIRDGSFGLTPTRRRR